MLVTGVPLILHIKFSNLNTEDLLNTVITLKLPCIIQRALSLGEPRHLNSLLTNRYNIYFFHSFSFHTLTLPILTNCQMVIILFAYALHF